MLQAGEADVAGHGDVLKDGCLPRMALHLRLFALLLRYKAITGHGFQAALPPAAFEVLKRRCAEVVGTAVSVCRVLKRESCHTLFY